MAKNVKLNEDGTVKNLICGYAIYDMELKAYNTPFFQPSDIHAKRSFITAVQDEESVINKFKDKFSLHEIGLFDMETGEFTQVGPNIILNASAVE